MAEDSTSFYRKLSPFDGTNWNSWKFRVSILLDEKNLSKYVEEDLDDLLEKTIDDDDEVKCILEEKKCKSILVQCIADSHLEYVQDKRRAKEMFDSLKGAFERKSVASQLYLRKKLITLKMDEADDMSDHFLVFDKTVRQLKSIGGKLEDLDIICYLLLSLPKSYDNLVTALETLDPDILSIDFVKGRLLDEFIKTKQSEGASCIKSSSPVAMNANEFKFKCYRCNQVGHKWFECKANNGQRANFAPEDYEFDANGPVAFFAKSRCGRRSEASGLVAKKEKFGEESRVVKMFLDSGGTNHMVNDSSLFDELIETRQVEIDVAKIGVTMNCNQKGDISAKLFCGSRATECLLKDVLLMEDLKCNLLSIGKMEQAGMEITFKNGAAYVSYKKKLLYIAPRCGKLYELNVVVGKKKSAEANAGKGNNLFTGVAAKAVHSVNQVERTEWKSRNGTFVEEIPTYVSREMQSPFFEQAQRKKHELIRYERRRLKKFWKRNKVLDRD